MSVRDRFLFENRTEDGEIGSLRCGVSNFAGSMTGDANSHAGRGARATLAPNLSYFSWEKVIGAQMYAVGATCHGNVCARVY